MRWCYIALLLAGCNSDHSVLLTLESDVAVEQYDLAINGEGIAATARFPETPAGPLASRVMTRVLLPRSAGALEILVRGLVGGAPVAEGRMSATAQSGREMNISVIVTALVCDAVTCPNSCCDGAVCAARSLAQCGSAGGACLACPATLADGCGQTGACQCGSGPPCTQDQVCTNGVCTCSCPGGCCDGAGVCRSNTSTRACGPSCMPCDTTKTDRCLDGVCSCGNAGACGDGQRCVAGACVCDAGSCAGCCAGSACLPGNTLAQCGRLGNACSPCISGCADGTCAECGPSSCTGCCAGSVCQTTYSGACGSSGAQCTPCPPGRADSCSTSDECRCGSGAACAERQACIGGTCTCTPTSCPDGCCNGSACTALAFAVCGAPAGACVMCDAERADHCTDEGCRCGSNPPCGADKVCRWVLWYLSYQCVSP